MGAHIVNGQFQSDKYPTCPPGKVPLSVKDKAAQDLLWEYAKRREPVDAEFSADLRTCLLSAGYEPPVPCLHCRRQMPDHEPTCAFVHEARSRGIDVKMVLVREYDTSDPQELKRLWLALPAPYGAMYAEAFK